MTRSSILFPKILFGSTDSTRRAWSEIATRAWENGGWHDVFCDSDLVEVQDESGPIIVWNDERRLESDCKPLVWMTNTPIWQLNWILQILPASRDVLNRDIERHFQFVMDGLRHEWFAVGVLQGDSGYLPFIRKSLHLPTSSSVSECNQFLIPFLKVFANWIPTLLQLDSRIAIANGRKKAGLKVVGLGQRLGLIGDLLWACGALPGSEAQYLLFDPIAVRPRTTLEVIQKVDQAIGNIKMD